MTFHPKPPFVLLSWFGAFQGHGISRRFWWNWGIDDSCIYNGTTSHHVFGLHHNAVNCIKKQYIQVILLPEDGGICTKLFHPALLPS